jgi:hypothetical protein
MTTLTLKRMHKANGAPYLSNGLNVFVDTADDIDWATDQDLLVKREDLPCPITT